MALNCWVVPTVIVGVAGVIAIDTRAALVTVKGVEEEIAPDVALIFAVPTPALVANPLEPAVLLITATGAASDAQLTVVVISCVVPSV